MAIGRGYTDQRSDWSLPSVAHSPAHSPLGAVSSPYRRGRRQASLPIPGYSCYDNFLNGFLAEHAQVDRRREKPSAAHAMQKSGSAPSIGSRAISTPSECELIPLQRERRQRMSVVLAPAPAVKSHATQMKLQALRRDACECLRLLVFGRVGNEAWPESKKKYIFEHGRGTEADVDKLVDLWHQIDANYNGVITMEEFVDFFEAKCKHANRSTGLRCARQLASLAREREARQTSACLKVQITSARGLANMDFGCTEGDSDVYCICEVPGKPHAKLKTRIIRDTCNPLWNHRGSIPDYSVGDCLLFTLWDYDVGKQDDFLGKVYLDSKSFHPGGFQGELRVAEAGRGIEAFLKVKVSPQAPTGHAAARRKSCLETMMETPPPTCPESQLCSREDLMRLLWLNADDEDIDAMNNMFQLSSLRLLRAPTPLLLPRTQQAELVENFRYLDPANKGVITYQSLIDAELIDGELMQELRSKYDKDGNDRLRMQDFLEMLCPTGFRANDDARRVIDQSGRTMTQIIAEFSSGGRFSGWFYDDDIRKLPLVDLY